MSDMDTEFDGLELLTPELKQRFQSINRHSNLRRDRSNTPIQSSASGDTTIGASTHSMGLGHPGKKLALNNPYNTSQVNKFTTNFNLDLLRTPRADNEYVIAAESCLKAHNTIDFTHFSNPLRLLAILKGVYAPTWASQGTPVFALVRNDSVATVMLRLREVPSSSGAGTLKQLQAWVGHRWGSIEDIVNSLPLLEARSYSGEEAYELQYQWWRENGEHFRLLDLPADLLPTVLLHLMGRTVYSRAPRPGQRNSQNLFLMSGFAGNDHLLARNYHFGIYSLHHRMDFPAVNESVILLNKAILPIAKSVLAKDTVKVFMSEVNCRPTGYLEQIVEHKAYNALENLRHVKLCYSNRAYCSFFSVQPVLVTGHEDRTCGKADLLRKLPNLRSLELNFLPCNIRESSPWEDEASLLNYRYKARMLYPCQNVVVDWILAYAFQYLSEVPKVVITGYIKSATKNKWDKLLSNPRRYESDEAVRRQINEIEVEMMQPRALPPRCFCPKRCAYVDLARLEYLYPHWTDEGVLKKWTESRDFALANWRFDFDDQNDDGRFIHGLSPAVQDSNMYTTTLELLYPEVDTGRRPTS